MSIKQKTSPKPKVFRYFEVVISVSALLVIIFGFLNISLPPRIMKADVSEATTIIYFSRAIDKKTLESAIQIEPSINFETYWGENNLYIKYLENLRSNTDYKINIKSSIKDTYGLNLDKEYQYTLHTSALTYFYLTKSFTGGNDVIYSKTITDSPEKIYESKDVKTFIANKEYLVINKSDKENTDKLSIYNLKTKQESNINLGTIRVVKLEFNPVKNEFAFIGQALEMQSGYFYPKNGALIYLYNIEKATTESFGVTNAQMHIVEIEYMPNGQALLFKQADGYYYAANMNDPKNPVLVDKDIMLGNFNQAGDKMAYLKYNNDNPGYYNLYIYNSSKDSTQISKGDSLITDPRIFPTSQKIAYALRYSPSNEYPDLNQIMVTDFNGNPLNVIRSEGNSLEIPLISPDERYLLIEKYTSKDLKNQYIDSIGFVFYRLYRSELFLYDIEQKKIINSQPNGVEAVWVK